MNLRNFHDNRPCEPYKGPDQEEETKVCFVCGYEPQEWDVKVSEVNGKLENHCPKCECEQ